MANLHHIKLSNIGPINTCELDIGKLTILTGSQANGKSTIAKSIFFFRTIKDDILTLALSRTSSDHKSRNLKNLLITHLRNKFMNLFGSTFAMPSDMEIIYNYGSHPKAYIKAYLECNYTSSDNPNILKFEFGQEIEDLLFNASEYAPPLGTAERDKLKNDLTQVFNDDSDMFFIPAGRSTITILSDQLNYIFNTLEQWQFKMIDYCTQKFVELILKVRPWFLEHRRMMQGNERRLSLNNAILQRGEKILHAKYRYENNEERLYLIGSDKYTKINLSSSGQQESVWILNLLDYFSAEKKKVFLVIEEPEAHLYPDAQMDITDLLSLFIGGGNNSAIITTHSPYILGELNNLILCGQIANEKNEKVKSLIDKRAWIKADSIKAFHAHDGIVENAINTSGLIKNELIDGASDIINERCDNLLSLLPEGDAE